MYKGHDTSIAFADSGKAPNYGAFVSIYRQGNDCCCSQDLGQHTNNSHCGNGPARLPDQVYFLYAISGVPFPARLSARSLVSLLSL